MAETIMAATAEGITTEGAMVAANVAEASNSKAASGETAPITQAIILAITPAMEPGPVSNKIISNRVVRQDGNKDPKGPAKPKPRSWGSNEWNVPNAPNVAPNHNAIGHRNHNGKNGPNRNATDGLNHNATGNPAVRSASRKNAPPPK